MPTPTPAAPTPTAENATLLRRFGGFLVDWVIASLVTFLVLPYDLVLEQGQTPRLLLGIPESSWVAGGVYVLLSTVLVALTGSSVGHRLFGLQVWQVRPGFFPLQVLVRSVLAVLVVPAVVTSAGRGLHDLAAGTRIVRVR